jgi:hypothetical protein
MASQKFPVSKDEHTKLTTSGNVGNDDNTLKDWFDHHAASSSEQARESTGATKSAIGKGTVKTKAKAVSVDGISSDLQTINVQAALMAFYDGPVAPSVEQATGSNTPDVDTKYFVVDNPTAFIDKEVGTIIPANTELFRLTSSINKKDNGGIKSIGSMTVADELGKVAEAQVTCGAYSIGGSYTDDTPSGANNIGSNNGNNIATYLRVGASDPIISNFAVVTAKKDIYVTPTATQEGRVRIVVSGVSLAEGTAKITMNSNTKSNDGKGYFRGSVKTIEISSTAQSTPVEEKVINLSPIGRKTYYLGVGYRRWFAGTINTNDPQSVMTALAGNGCRQNSQNITVKKDGKVTNGTTDKLDTNIVESYFWIAIPATKKLTAVKHKDSGLSETPDGFVQLQYTSGNNDISTIDVNGANNMFATPYKVYMIANSANTIIKYNVSEYFKFTIADN